MLLSASQKALTCNRIVVQVGFTALLLGWPPLSGLFATTPFDARLGPLVLLTPLVVILADDLHKFSSKYLGTKKARG